MSTANTATPGADRLRQVVAAGHDVWRAGLGAAAEVGAEGRSLFDRLVERGRPLDERTRRTWNAWGDQAGDKLRELGELVEDQVRYDLRQVMEKVGLPTLEDYKVLASRLETLSHRIDELARYGGPVAVPAVETTPDAPAAKAARTPTRKTAVTAKKG